jgi:hypothetical protein
VRRVREIVSSPRRRRRLALGTGVAALAVGLVTVGVVWPNTADEVPSTLEPGEPRVYHEPKAVKLTQTSRAEALATAANFVKTAVARRNIDRSWLLASPALREGYTRAEWSGGEIPVVPYPVAEARWKLDYTYADAVGLQVLLFPKPGSGMRPNLFLMELKPLRSSAHRHWVVDSWIPSGTANPALAAPAAAAGGGGGGTGVGVQSLDPGIVGNTESRLGSAWLFAPLGLFAIVPIVLVVFGVRSWRRARRAERAYREHAERRAGVPL